MAEQSEREREIFSSALDRPTPAERMAYVDGACGNDAELHSRVVALLRAHDLAGGFLPMDTTSEPLARSAPTLRNTNGLLPVAEKPGDWIGPYKLREKVGEGGCGAVYVAEQERPVRRRVALKVIKLGMDTKSVIARFEAERQALAMMDHPNIARVLDAGATEAGRPYFVMELVRGIKITDYCDQNRLSTNARLQLFIKVCQAIQHAHQKGIIHRDIKPSNILVTLHDGVPVPKIIDFGIAKAIAGKLTDLTVYTDLHQFIGTPAYMSPEQAETSGLDIDTRADIYSLGVLLYELLTGKTPFDGKVLLQSGLEAMRKTICDTEPIRPSTRLSTMVNAELTTVAQCHGAEPLRLVNLIRGDLDWIVMKALEKDRTRRYETANGLAMDVQRHLSNEPILARPQSSAYRFQKLVRRNKLIFTAAGAVSAALVFGLAGTLWQWRQSERNHQEAQANLYAADMNRAAQVLDDLGPVAARALLKRHAGQTNLHGFEWRYLWKRCLGDFSWFSPSRGKRVWKIVFSPSNTSLVAMEEGGALRMLSLKTHEETVCMTNVTGVAGYTANGRELILALGTKGDSRMVRFDPTTRRIVELGQKPKGLGWLPDLLADGFTAVLPGTATNLSLVDTRSGETRSQFKLPNDCIHRWNAFVESCAVSSDGRYVFCLDNGPEYGTVGVLSVRDPGSGEVLASYRDEAPGTPKTVITDRVYMLRFLPGGTTAIWASRDGYLHSWRWADKSARPLAQQGHRGVIWDIACSVDGTRLATVGEDQTVRLWDPENLHELRVLRGHDSNVFTVAFSHDGRWLASGGDDGTIKLWDLGPADGPGEVPVIAARELANRLVFAPDSRSFAVGTEDDGVTVINAESCQATTTLTNLLFPARFLPDGVHLIGLGGVGNLIKGNLERTVEAPEAYFWAYDVSSDARWLIRSFRSGLHGDVTEFLDLKQGSVITNFIDPSVMVAARFTADGRTLLSSDSFGSLAWWNVSPNGLTRTRVLETGQFNRAIALSSDGAMVALGGLSRLTIVDFRTGQIRHRLFGHGNEINGVAYSPDGGTLASCSNDGTVKLWNLRIMQEVCTITFDVKHALGKEIGVQGVAFSPDGNSLWAFSRSGVVKCWRAATPDEIVAGQRAEKL